MKNIAEFVYQLNELGFFLWLDKGKLKYRQYKEITAKNEIIEEIKENKTKIINLLKLNNCNGNVINQQHIYMSDSDQEVLSFAQERLWFVEKYEEGTNAYNIPMIFKLNNAKLELLEKSIRSIVSRHEILRTLIKEDEEGNGYQLIMNENQFPIHIARINIKDRIQLDQLLDKEINRIYNLNDEYPIRVCLYELVGTDSLGSTKEHYLSILIHHIAFDGWSMDILLKELQVYYKHYLEESLGMRTKLDLPTLNIQYKDFALWQRYYLKGEKLKTQLSYWENRLNGYETLNLATDRPRPKKINYQGHEVYFKIDEDTSLALRELAKEFGVSLYSLLLAGYYLMLKCYSNQDDIVVGTPVANRHYNQVENLIGFFVNSLALRTRIKSNTTVKDFIQKVGNETIEALLYQDLPFEKLVENLKIVKDPSRHPVFQVLFGVQSFGRGVYNQDNIQANEDIKNILEGYTTETNLYSIARFDISTFIDDSEVCLNGSFNYAISIYTESTITRFIETYVEILKEFATLLDNPEKQRQTMLFNLNYLNKEQYKQLIYTRNQTDGIYPEQTIQALFEEQARRTPNNIAVVYENERLTYQQLNDRSNILAEYLISLGAGPEILIGVGIHRQIELIIGLIGILKTGAAYVPLDPEYPGDRLKYMIEDSNLKILLVTKDSKDSFHYFKDRLVLVDQINYNYSKQDRKYPIFSTPDTLAYITYTSGSTGKPKGVASHHRGVINRLKWAWDKYPFNKDEVCCLQSSICFVDSTWDIFGTLLIGFPLILYKPSLGRNVESFLQQCYLSKITRITLLPSFLAELIKLAQSDTNIFNYFEQIKHLEVTGEFFKSDIFLNFIRTFNRRIVFLDCYGATEATSVIYKDFKRESECLTRVISNTKIYVLSEYLSPVPIGSIGELYIGGIGLARGYLNKTELTAERFIANPFVTEEEMNQNKNLRLYKTGDLVRWLSDGNIEYLGRNDFQVKIRGYRIELGEIESILSSFEGIKQSVVIAKENKNSKGELSDNKYLVGYYVSLSKLDEEAIISYLREKLPDYMIPALLVNLAKIPLTNSGKIDRNKLPDPTFTNIDSYVAPRNKIEAKVCHIWGEILGLNEKKIGIFDDFFRLGGNSILAIKLASKLNKELHINISISSIFKQNTVAKLVTYLDQKAEEKIVIDKAIFTKSQERPLSFAQERLWFIEKYEEGTNAYNMPHIFKLSNDIKIDLLEHSILSIVARHEVLRTLIKEDKEGKGYQLVLNANDNPFKIARLVVNSQSQLNQEIEKIANQLFDLNVELPIRVCLYEVKDSEEDDIIRYYLSVVIHHIAFDGWSYVVFFKELQTYYEYYLNQSSGLDSRLNLPNLPIQYADFAVWQRKYLSGERLDKQINYWRKKLKGFETLNLPTDRVRASMINYKGRDIYFELDESLSRHLRELAKDLKVSLYSLLLAGYYLMLRSYSNQDDIIVGTPIANRHYDQIENLIGFFVNALALRAQIDSNVLIKDFIQAIGQEVVEAQLHQDLPFEKLVEELNLVKDTSRHPIFQIVFGVQGFGGEVYNKIDEQKTTNITNLLHPYSTGDTLFNIAKFDISTFIDDSQVCLRGTFNYAISLYDEITISRFIETYIRILRQFSDLVNNEEKKHQRKIIDLNYLSQNQYEQIINQWNQPAKNYPNDQTIQALFEEQVEKTPNNVAILYQDNKLTYRELNEKSNQIAHYLISCHNIKPETLIALCLDRSEHLMIAILGVLKTGAGYVPIDPASPNERVKYILDDTTSSIILVNEKHHKKIQNIIDNKSPSLDCKIKNLDPHILAINSEDVEKQLSLQSVDNPNIDIKSSNIAYVIYTSGTTGNPKGVLQTHGNVQRLFTATNEWYQFNQNDVWTLFHSYVFDFSVWEMWGALIYGGKLIIPSYDQTRDPNIFYKLCKQEGVTILNQTPTAFYQFLNVAIAKDNCDKLTNLKYVIFGGEALNLSQLSPWFIIYGYNQPKLINMYGITETTVHVTYKMIEEHDLSENSYIGRIIPDLRSYILNNSLTPLPIGAIGELYVGGEGLARGYLNKPELTAEKFIANPFITEQEQKHNKNSRLYKTGDLVRWVSDGNMEYIGRNDFQVKIRGYRIELGEIEAALSSYELVKQSVVLVKDRTDNNGNLNETKYLVAYFVKELNLQKADTEDFVDSWETTYQLQYSSLDETYFKQNFKGWNSSYTDEPIAKEDMLEWVNATIDRISQLSPNIILEIGSGSGLIVFNIIDKCNYYYATDFSINAISHINKIIDKFGFNNKISTLACRADELPYKSFEKSYDTVVLNSIIQYFPNLDYLEKVIIEAILNMKGIGQIFIGDIRDYRLLKCFHYSVQNFKQGKVTKSDIDYFSKRDKELLVSPEYFMYLKTINKYISYVEALPKFGKSNHEMNNYRYDVIIHINKNENATNQNDFSVNEENFVKVLDFENYFTSNKDNEYLCIKYPNKRILKDYIEFNELCGIIHEINKNSFTNILSMSEISDKIESENYQAKFLLDINDPIYFNIIIYKNNIKEKNLYINYLAKSSSPRSELANNPLVTSKLLTNQFAKELRIYLNSKLPEYMVPEHYIQLERLPLTINGKLDRKALPDPDFVGSDIYIAPRNELENTLCQIWGEVLGLEQNRVGIRDDFFRLGGNSILAIRLASMINSHYQAHLKVSDIFVYKNIELLLLRMLQTKDTYQTIVKLNNTFKKPNMFMIHPGIGGCEVYISLANRLGNSYSCYGIDSYNLYHHKKIESMHELAKYYLSYIDNVMIETHQHTYHLFGWSLGGHIALEIANILEQRGESDIKVYLIDAVIYDESLFSELEKDVEKTKILFKENAVAKGFDLSYIEKSISNMDAETKLSKQKLSSSLNNTKALFLKAMLGDTKYKMDEYHNIDKLFKNKSNIKLIKVIDAHHGNILDQEELLVSKINEINSVSTVVPFNKLEYEVS